MTADRIRIDLAKHSAIAGLMLSRGVPRYLLKGVLDIDSHSLSPCRAPHCSTIAITTQLNFLRKTLTQPLQGEWWMVVGSQGDDAQALRVAVAVMQQATLHSVREPHAAARPLWWSLYGGRWDKLRDDENFRTNFGRIGLLVLSNVNADSTPEKVEKCGDLLHMYSGIPRVLVVNGVDPLAFCMTRLYRRPSRVIYLSRRMRVKQV